MIKKNTQTKRNWRGYENGFITTQYIDYHSLLAKDDWSRT